MLVHSIGLVSPIHLAVIPIRLTATGCFLQPQCSTTAHIDFESLKVVKRGNLPVVQVPEVF